MWPTCDPRDIQADIPIYLYSSPDLSEASAPQQLIKGRRRDSGAVQQDKGRSSASLDSQCSFGATARMLVPMLVDERSGV